MAYNNVKYEIKDEIGFVTINRPDSLNALNSELLGELYELFTEIKDDDKVKAVIVTGEGRAFVAGADIAEMVKLETPQLRKMAAKGQAVMNLIEDIDKIVIAAVNGFALGGGNELAMACDFRFASEKAKFGQPEVNLGIMPFFGGTQRLPRLVGNGMAKYLICSAEMVNAEEAMRIGLVEKVFPAEELMDEVIKFTKLIMTKSPIGVSMAINAVNKGTDMDRKNAIDFEKELTVNCYCSEDRMIGMKAFLNKEEPKFLNK
jgi:enoyl-CoA hydratase